MPIPKPRKGEKRQDFISRCMGDDIMQEYPQKQRAGVCYTQWKNKSKRNAMELTTQKIKQNSTIPIRTEMFEGQEHLVVPVVMMVEGVHHGSGGPLYYSAEVLSANVQTWNGMPVPIHHPESEEGPLSANSPDVREQWVVGTLFNAAFENGKLKAEAWINIAKATKIDPALVSALRSGAVRMDVSTGVYTEEINTSGTWNGEDYVAIVTDIRPDHLALLPGGTGACSWADGCGVRANESGEDDMLTIYKVRTNDDIKLIAETLANPKCMETKCAKENLAAVVRAMGYAVNELSNDEVRQKLQAEVDKLDSRPEPQPAKMHFIRDVYNEFFVYEMREFSGDGPGESKLFKQDYSVSNDEIKLKGKPVEVKEERSYVAMVAAGKDQKVATKRTRGNAKQKGESAMTKDEMIQKIIGNEGSVWTENDQEMLEGLSEDRLKAVMEGDEHKTMLDKANAKIKELEAAKVKDVPVTPPPADEVPVTMEQYIASAPPEMREVIQESLAMRANKKADLVQRVMGIKGNAFTQEELATMPIPHLEKMVRLASIDYSGQTGGHHTPTVPKMHERQPDGRGVPLPLRYNYQTGKFEETPEA